MVDTIRSDAELDTLLRDNSVGEISPQDIRDLWLSLRAGGSAGYLQNTTPQLLGPGVNVLDLPNAGQLQGFTFDAGNDSLVAGVDGVFEVQIILSLSGDIGEFEFAVLQNDSPVQATRMKASVDHAGQFVNVVSVPWRVNVTAGDTFKLGALGDGLNVTPYGGGLQIGRT